MWSQSWARPLHSTFGPEGVSKGGMDSLNLGPAPPELLAFALGTEGGAGAAYIGGGNGPASANGVRFWHRDGSPLGAGVGLEKVGLIARRLRTGRSRLPGISRSAELLPDYVKYVRKFAPRLRPLRVVLDGGCGAASRLLDAVFMGLPLRLTRLSFGSEGAAGVLGERFPSRPLVSSMRSSIRDQKADFGAALDYAGERVAFFDGRGEMLAHDVAAALIAGELLARGPGACVTCDARAGIALRTHVIEAGGKIVSAPVSTLAFGQQFRRTESVYGADLTGMHYFKDYFRFPSPVVAILMFCSSLSREARPVTELTGELARFSRSDETVIAAPSAECAKAVLERVKEEFQNEQRELIDGVTVRLEGWWFNLRQPGSMAELRLTVEGRTRREERSGRQQIDRFIGRLLAEMKP
jgi:phosphomannomutase